jgi:hypothetical protein
LFSLQGRPLLQIESSPASIDVSGLPPGLYLLVLQADMQVVGRFRVVKF